MKKTTKKRPRILIVDDEPVITDLLKAILDDERDCTAAGSAEEAIALLESETFDLVVSDINLGGIDGIELISRIKAKTPDAVVMLISGNSAIESPIEALRCGAFDYIKKPFEIDQVVSSVNRAIAHGELQHSKQKREVRLERLVAERTDRLKHLAIHDSITGLANAARFESNLSQTLKELTAGEFAAVIIVVFNGLNVNRDRLGRATGTKLLNEIAKRLCSLTDAEPGVARIDGDEFALLCRSQDRKKFEKLADDILKICVSPVVTGGHEIYLSANVGISVYPDDGGEVQELMKNAGAALATSRENGGNNYQFYTAEIHEKSIKRLSIENDLRHALERNEFEVLYQPKIDVSSKRVTGMEALIRWHHPTLGMVPPDEFIHIAEEMGAIFSIGEWILRTACQQSKIWHDKGFDLEIAVNLSPIQFQQPDLLSSILRIVKETGIDPNMLNLEVTESSIMGNTESAINVLHELRDNGIKISVDDFGTGHSSLGYLKYLPIDVLKIDRSFINDVTTDQDNASLVMTIISLAHTLRLKVVAEGVQTEEQLRFLHLLRCDEWQGYLFSPPVSAAAFENLLVSSGHDHSVSPLGARSHVHDEIVRLSHQ